MTAQERQQLLSQHHRAFLNCAEIKSAPVAGRTGTLAHVSDVLLDAYDIDEVEAELGPQRFDALMQFILKKPSSLICHGHRHWPKDHPEEHKRGAEVHCVRASDLEEFLKGGG
jgi:hypothetical protein